MKFAIIGAGASGLLLAGKFSKSNINYDIFNDGKIGSKLLASGNGKCNISNINNKSKYYHNSSFYDIILPNQKELFNYFIELGIYTKYDNEGRMYPYSESSQSVLTALLKCIDKQIIDEKIEVIKKNYNQFFLNDKYGPYDKIILATGSKASLIKSKAISYNNYLESINVKINKLKPSLCGFIVKEKIKEVSGARAKAKVTLYNNNKLIHIEAGEVIFKDDGISGICIMNLSSYYAHLKKLDNPYLILDLACDLTYSDLTCILNPKLLMYVNKHQINPHELKINIIDTYSLENSQVACGGIPFNEFNKNLSLIKDDNIYVTGELLDIDGVCGGYNLMSAFCSALVVYRSIKNEI